jgi:16S rRNA pseudouridine516 synthase
MSTIQRIDRILSNMGYGTRKEVKKLISSGLVEIDGIIVKDSGQKAAVDSQEIKVGGKRVFYRDFIYIMMNKPKGVISSTEDRFNRTVIDLLSDEFKTFSPFPVGRLDKDAEGLLLLTNDGQLSHRLLSPQKHVPKTYMAKIAGRVSERDVEAFGRGIILEDGYKTMSSELEVLERGSISLVEVTIYEGKFHQVKRMFQAVGKEVVYLKRISMGELKLDEALEPGEYRELNEEEREILP